MTTEVRPVQLAKASFPIEVTDEGMGTEARQEQLKNALSPIEVTELGIIKSPSTDSGTK